MKMRCYIYIYTVVICGLQSRGMKVILQFPAGLTHFHTYDRTIEIRQFNMPTISSISIFIEV